MSSASLSGAYGVAPLLGTGDFYAPVVNAKGGFDAYHPVAELAAQGIYVLQLSHPDGDVKRGNLMRKSRVQGMLQVTAAVMFLRAERPIGRRRSAERCAESVVVAGSFQAQVGCPGDWLPDCAESAMTYDAEGDVWVVTFYGAGAPTNTRRRSTAAGT